MKLKNVKSENSINSLNKNIILGLLVVLLMVIPLMINRDAAFEGSDGGAGAIIQEINPDYIPWANFLFEPPSGEIETLLFCIQTAIGTGVIFYYLGYYKAKKKYKI